MTHTQQKQTNKKTTRNATKSNKQKSIANSVASNFSPFSTGDGNESENSKKLCVCVWNRNHRLTGLAITMMVMIVFVIIDMNLVETTNQL